MTLGPTVRTTRAEATGSPGSRSATLVRAQLRKPSSARPARAARLRAWPSASATATPRGGMAKTEPVAVLAGQLHRARAEARDVERDLRLEAEILRVVRQHPDGANAVVVAVVHRLAAQQGGQHA